MQSADLSIINSVCLSTQKPLSINVQAVAPRPLLPGLYKGLWSDSQPGEPLRPAEVRGTPDSGRNDSSSRNNAP